jgi:hypothetical protein
MCRCRGEVDYTAPHERSTIIDPHGHAAAIAFICHAHAGAKRQRAVRRCETIRLSAFATGSTLTRIRSRHRRSGNPCCFVARANSSSRSGGLARAGGLGLGTIILLGLLGWALGINPFYLIGGAEMLSRMSRSTEQSQPAPQAPRTEAPSDSTREFVSAVLGSTEVQWQEIFERAGKTYQAPSLVMFSGATHSACGFAQSPIGPFLLSE